jgi:hypothetical protein
MKGDLDLCRKNAEVLIGSSLVLTSIFHHLDVPHFFLWSQKQIRR